jgi:hypothetical protein
LHQQLVLGTNCHPLGLSVRTSFWLSPYLNGNRVPQIKKHERKLNHYQEQINQSINQSKQKRADTLIFLLALALKKNI